MKWQPTSHTMELVPSEKTTSPLYRSPKLSSGISLPSRINGSQGILPASAIEAHRLSVLWASHMQGSIICGYRYYIYITPCIAKFSAFRDEFTEWRYFPTNSFTVSTFPATCLVVRISAASREISCCLSPCSCGATTWTWSNSSCSSYQNTISDYRMQFPEYLKYTHNTVWSIDHALDTRHVHWSVHNKGRTSSLCSYLTSGSAKLLACAHNLVLFRIISVR